MEPIPKYTDPMSQIAKEMNIDMSSSKQTPKVTEIAQLIINKLVEEKLAWKNKDIRLIVETSQSIFDLGASASSEYVFLPPLYFISKDEALYFLATGKPPSGFRDEVNIPLTGPDDPRLDDEVRLQEFANYLSNKLGIPPKAITWEDRMHLRMYISTIHKQNDTTINDTISFIIMHELGHVKEGHLERELNYKKKLITQKKYVIINYLTFGVFALIATDLQSRKHEKEADRFGYTGLYSKPEGGIHLFKTVKEFKPKGCKEIIAYALFCFSTLGSHGTYGRRGRRIEKHLAKLKITKLL